MFGQKRKDRERRKKERAQAVDPRSLQACREWGQHFLREKKRAKARWTLT
jgi:hypothetical protein